MDFLHSPNKIIEIETPRGSCRRIAKQRIAHA
jgi:hypothetical protein